MKQTEHLNTSPPAERPSMIDASDEYDMLKNPYDRYNYLALTDELIHRMEGSEDEPRPDVVVYLDKSARPISWMVRELWDDLAREPGTDFADHNVPPMPETAFVNVDSEREYTRKDIEGLRSLFTIDPVKSPEEAADKPTYFDGKHLLIVDEEGVSHAVSNKAKRFFELAFPGAASIDTHIWMDKGAQSNYGGRGIASDFDINTWQYKENNSTTGGVKPDDTARWYIHRPENATFEEKRIADDGRGVIELDAAYPEERARLEQSDRFRHGLKWLSAAPAEMTEKTKSLRADIHRLAEEFRGGGIPYLPAKMRDDRIERMRAAENEPSMTIDDMNKFKNWFKDAWWGDFRLAPGVIERRDPYKSRLQRSMGTVARRVAELHGLL